MSYKFHIKGMMTLEKVEKMRIQAMNCMQDKEHNTLSTIIQNYLLPAKWNMMDIEFGVNQ